MSKNAKKSRGFGDLSGLGRSILSSLEGLVGSSRPTTGSRGDRPLDSSVADMVDLINRTGHHPDDRQMREFLASHSRVLGIAVKRRLFPRLQGVPDGLTLGWVQWPDAPGRGFALGIFTDRRHFAQIALADDHGRVFIGEQSRMDLQNMEPAFLLGREEEVTLADGRRLGRDPGQDSGPVRALQGAVAGRDDAGHMRWLASWLRADGRYSLEQLRPLLPPEMRLDLEYRDAVAIAFFAAYLLPRIQGTFTGFGSGNIFYRLNREAPMGAIRRSVGDMIQARSHGQRVSGLEDLFADLMREAGALSPVSGLEAVHGAEPLHLYASSYSGAYFLSWDNGLEFTAALAALRIEGNLNRFAAVSAWLERNARLGALPTEDSINRVQATRLDQALLDDPAIVALLRPGDYPIRFDPLEDDGRTAINAMVDKAAATAVMVSQQAPQALPVRADGQGQEPVRSEWVYRQTLSMLMRSLRLPFRFDVEFRSNLAQGQVALAFTAAGRTMMPSSRYEDQSRAWRDLDDGERSAMSADYNLRVGLMMAALAFGVDPSVREVSLQIDSIGLEEAVDQQNSAIRTMMGQALEAFERMRSGEVAPTGSKADPKDGDVHGDPTKPIASRMAPEQQEGNEEDKAEDQGEKESVDREFKDLMQGVDLDSAAFAPPSSANDSDADESTADDASKEDVSNDDASADKTDDDASQNPLSALQSNPTIRTLVSVVFSRELFLSRIRSQGLKDPRAIYRFFDAAMQVDPQGGLKPTEAEFDMRDDRFSPHGSQEEPEFSEVAFADKSAKALGAHKAVDLSIQRADLLQRAVGGFHQLASDRTMTSAAKAQAATGIIQSIGDPELEQLAPQVASAMIDGTPVPDFDFSLSSQLDKERVKARDLLFSGGAAQGIQVEQDAIAHLDAVFAAEGQVPRYFNSYAERVVYNRLFATPGERTLLIPDNLFYAHLEIADLLAQIKEDQAALKHLNAMVAYAPAYPLSHLKLAVMLANREDWDSARAATLNALRVALDRDDASFAYYRLAYASWMRDEFDVAAAAYLMSEHISPDRIPALKSELAELQARARSQCVVLPEDHRQARRVLAEHGLPVWPHTEVASIVRQAARICVDGGLFVPARTLSMAAARMNDDDNEGVDVVQAQFMRSLNA